MKTELDYSVEYERVEIEWTGSLMLLYLGDLNNFSQRI